MYISKLQIAKQTSQCKGIFKGFRVKKIKRIAIKNNKKYVMDKNEEYAFLLNNVDGHALDYAQREIVLSEEDSTLVIAGAGSGKTLIILARILYLVKCGVNPKDILCISFTNQACESLRKKLFRNGIDMDVYTFHKIGIEILKANGLSTKIVNSNVLFNIISDVLVSKNFFDILPDYNFKDYGDGDFNFLHHNIAVETKEFFNLKMLFATFINLFKGNNYNVLDFDKFIKLNENEVNKFVKFRNRKILDMAKEIYDKYIYYLDKNKQIDFHDMINKATYIVKNKGVKNYKYIIIDEYQDISFIKCEFIKAIKEKCGAKIMAVGDDFQSIYRFTGSNLNVFLNFSKYFPYNKVFKLEKTYRNSNELLDIMGKFILKNDKQIQKKLISSKYEPTPVFVYYYDNNFMEVLNEILARINTDVLIIGRNNKDINNINVNNGVCMTAHKSKGLEADNVVIVNMTDDVTGFPNKIVSDDVLKYVTDIYDEFPFEEERRLFYVAMTRTRNCNYLMVNKNHPSEFITELLAENRNIRVMNEILYCPKCKGTLIKRHGKYGEFYGCTNFPKCRFTQKID